MTDFGRVVNHIKSFFDPGMFGKFGRLETFEHELAQDILAFGQGEGFDDYFQFSIRGLPREQRERLIQERTRLLGFDTAFEEFPEAFRVRKPPTITQEGYGAFALPRAEFVQQTDPQEVAGRLAYIAQTHQIDQTAIGADQFRLSGTMLKEQFLQQQAQQIVDAPKLSASRATRLIFDVETSGVDAGAEVWQLSARLMRGDETLNVADLHFKAPMMEKGLYPGRMSFEDFYKSLRGDVEFRGFEEGITDFFKMVDEADVMVAHNAPFDVRKLEYGIKKTPAYKNVPEFKQAADRFLAKATTEGKLIDTRMFSMAVFGEGFLDERNIAAHLRKADKFTPYAMENIMLETTFLRDLAKRIAPEHGNVDDAWRIIRGHLATGMHHGDVDTWFLDHLYRMQLDVLSGKVKDPNFLKVEHLQDNAIREMVSRSSSITPFTKMAELGDMTPFEYLAKETRQFGTPLRADRVTMGQLQETGLFSRWADKLLTTEGKIAHGAILRDPDFGPIPGVADALGRETIQGKAISSKLPFAGLSAPERLLSTLLGQHTNKFAPAKLNEARRLMGEITGGGLGRATQEARVFGGRNIALPMELLLEAERAGALAGTQFERAMSRTGPEAFQQLRLSTIPMPGGERDIAYVADILTTDSAVDRFRKYLRSIDEADYAKLGITRGIDDIDTALQRGVAQKYGIQVGIAGGKDSKSVQRLAHLMDQLGFDLDSMNMKLRVGMFGPTEEMVKVLGKDVSDLFFTTPTIIDTTGEAIQANLDDILRQTKATSEMTELMTARASMDPQMLRRIEARKGIEAPRNMYRFLEEGMDKIRPRHLGIGAAILGGYYLYNRSRDRRVTNETLQTQEFESPMFYERYKQEMGEPLPRNYGMRPLQTAGTVQNLDYNKVNHSFMGSQRYNHLFGG